MKEKFTLLAIRHILVHVTLIFDSKVLLISKQPFLSPPHRQLLWQIYILDYKIMVKLQLQAKQMEDRRVGPVKTQSTFFQNVGI